MSSVHNRPLQRTASYPSLSPAAPAQAPSPALDLAAPRTGARTATPAAPTPPAPCPGAHILSRFGERDSNGVPRDMLDPIALTPMAQPERVALIDEAALFADGPVTWPQYETYDHDSLNEALRHQRDDHSKAWTVAPFQPISPLSRRHLVTTRGQVVRRPDDALRTTIRHFLAQDPQVWEALTPAQQEAARTAEALLDMGRGDAVLSALRSAPASPTAGAYFNAMCKESERVREARTGRRLPDGQSQPSAFERLMRLVAEMVQGPESTILFDLTDGVTEVTVQTTQRPGPMGPMFISEGELDLPWPTPPRFFIPPARPTPNAEQSPEGRSTEREHTPGPG
ncbi:MAG TPA: hypothetical protein VFH51_07250 [Myxococcota bacterium]|nr:hypothetical protein [Myxococcota bacterium]